MDRANNRVAIGFVVLLNAVLGTPLVKAGDISAFLRVEGRSISDVVTVTTGPGVFVGRASILLTEPGTLLFSVTDPPIDNDDIFILNIKNLTGQVIDSLVLRLGQFGANSDLESLQGGPSFEDTPTIGGDIIKPDYLLMEGLEWESGDDALAVNPLLSIPSADTFTNQELAIQIQAIAVPEPTAFVCLGWGCLTLLWRSRRIK